MTLCHAHRKTDPFVRFNKSIVYDKSLSLKAKGLLSIAFSRPDNWTFYKSEMMKHCSDGEHSFDSGVKELEKSGYLYRTRKQNKKNGRLEGWEWHFFEEPISKEDFKKFIRNGGFPGIGETPRSGKPTPNKKDSLSKKENNKKEDVVVSSSSEDFDQLEIPEGTKLKIIKEHNEKIPLLVKRVLSWTGRESDLKAVWVILRMWDEWVDSKTLEETQSKNEQMLDNTGFRDGDVINNHRVYMGNKVDGRYIQFICGQRVDEFNVCKKSFIKDLVKYAKERLNIDLEKQKKHKKPLS